MTVELILGDCLEVMKGMDDKSVDAILTDLPYGTTACSWDEIIPFEPMWEQVKRICKGVFVTTASQPFTTDVINSNREMFRYELIWNKKRGSTFALANKMPIKTHENILVFYGSMPTYNPQKTVGKPYDKTMYNGGKNKSAITKDTMTIKKNKNNGDRFPTSILTISQNWRRQDQIHPTQKPIALYEYLIRTYTNEGDTVLDITMGSGTTLVACVKTGRNGIGIDNNAEYFAIAEQRIHEAQMQPRLL